MLASGRVNFTEAQESHRTTAAYKTYVKKLSSRLKLCFSGSICPKCKHISCLYISARYANCYNCSL